MTPVPDRHLGVQFLEKLQGIPNIVKQVDSALVNAATKFMTSRATQCQRFWG